MHRDHGPAKIIKKNNKSIEEWYQNGKLLRSDGPAVIFKCDHGKLTSFYWIREEQIVRSVVEIKGRWYLQDRHQTLHQINGPDVVDIENAEKILSEKGIKLRQMIYGAW